MCLLVLWGEVLNWKGRVVGQGKRGVEGYSKRVVVCQDGGRGVLLLRGRILVRLMLVLWEEEIHEGHEMEYLLGCGRWSVERWGEVVA